MQTPQFGTSGLRGLVTALTPDLIAEYVTAFLRACPVGGGLYVGRDLRSSSPRIAADVIATARAAGVDVWDCGAVPTPALALAAMSAGCAAIMVTGSHIPDDRNGLKFYTPQGELSKAGEAAILAALHLPAPEPQPQGALRGIDPGPAFVARSVTAFGPQALQGWHIGLWSHSAVGRDLLGETLRGLGAKVTEFGREAQFVPVDTEAVSEVHRAYLRGMAAQYGVDAIVSTDGDGDRPLLADARGEVVPGDLLGQISAAWLGADVVVTPVSSNTGAEASGAFDAVLRTRIGSPYVIDALEKADALRPVGYEANGGFLLGFDAGLPGGPLPALMTRDSHLPLIATLVSAGAGGLAARLAAEPARFTAADRLQEVAQAASAALVQALQNDEGARSSFVAGFASGDVSQADTTDGLRLTLSTGRILHLRPSGNAPELRFYTEAETPEMAASLLATGLSALRRALG